MDLESTYSQAIDAVNAARDTLDGDTFPLFRDDMTICVCRTSGAWFDAADADTMVRNLDELRFDVDRWLSILSGYWHVYDNRGKVAGMQMAHDATGHLVTAHRILSDLATHIDAM